MATYNFRVKYSKSKDQQFVTIRKTGGDNIAGIGTLTANIYTDDFNTPDSTYVLTSDELTSLKSNGYVMVQMAALLGDNPADGWYSIILTEGTTYASVLSGFGVTLQATAKVYGKQGYTGVYNPDYRIDEVLHVAHMLLMEINALEDLEVSFQKREDFQQRLATLKKILKY